MSCVLPGQLHVLACDPAHSCHPQQLCAADAEAWGAGGAGARDAAHDVRRGVRAQLGAGRSPAGYLTCLPRQRRPSHLLRVPRAAQQQLPVGRVARRVRCGIHVYVGSAPTRCPDLLGRAVPAGGLGGSHGRGTRSLAWRPPRRGAHSPSVCRVARSCTQPAHMWGDTMAWSVEVCFVAASGGHCKRCAHACVCVCACRYPGHLASTRTLCLRERHPCSSRLLLLSAARRCVFRG